MDPLQELKTRAALLQRKAQAGDAAACERLQLGPEAPVQRKHCLEAIAREHGFEHWRHAHEVLSGGVAEQGYGDLLYPPRTPGFLFDWFADLEQARRHLRDRGGFLLPYRRQAFVATATYIDTLGWDPADPVWSEIGHDFTAAHGGDVRRRLYGLLLTASPAENA